MSAADSMGAFAPRGTPLSPAQPVTTTRVVVPDNLGVRIQLGDRITFVKAGFTRTRTVEAVEERHDFGFLRLHCFDQEAS